MRDREAGIEHEVGRVTAGAHLLGPELARDVDQKAAAVALAVDVAGPVEHLLAARRGRRRSARASGRASFATQRVERAGVVLLDGPGGPQPNSASITRLSSALVGRAEVDRAVDEEPRRARDAALGAAAEVLLARARRARPRAARGRSARRRGRARRRARAAPRRSGRAGSRRGDRACPRSAPAPQPPRRPRRRPARAGAGPQRHVSEHEAQPGEVLQQRAHDG